MTIATGNLGNIKWLALMSWLTWFDASMSAWRSDVPDEPEEE